MRNERNAELLLPTVTFITDTVSVVRFARARRIVYLLCVYL